MIDEATVAAVYVDANRFIYFIDGQETVANHLRPFFEFLKQKPSIAMTSELTLAEVLAKATLDARRNYLNLIVWSGIIRLQAITREILINTADYRRINRTTRADGTSSTPKLADAIHVVTAAQSRCRMFVSADSGLKVPSEMIVFKPDDVGLSKLMRELS